MKSVLYLVLAFSISLAVNGQTVRDSLVSKTWMGGLADYLKFDTVSKQATFMFYVSQDKRTSADCYAYSIEDSSITLHGIGPIRNCEIHLRYHYFGDSLVIDIVSLNRSCVDTYHNIKEYERQLTLRAKASS